MSCYRNILVALDGSADAEAGLRHSFALARDQNAKLTLLSVVQRPPTPLGPGVPSPVEMTPIHEEILRRAVDKVPDDIGVTTRLERGDPAETILRIVAEGGHDLIVMGSHGHGRVRRALLGSVSERVLHSSTVPVLLMRGRSVVEEARADGEKAGDGAAPPEPDPA